MTRCLVRQGLKAAIMILAVMALSGSDHRERERFMTESNEFLTLFNAALAERGTTTKLHRLVEMCRTNAAHLAHLKHEVESPDARRALLANTALFWMEKLPVVRLVVRYLTKTPPADVYPGGAPPHSASHVHWYALAVVKHVGTEASIPLLDFVARYPDTRVAQGARMALVDLWDALIMDRPLFAMFSDASYSDRYRLTIASSFAKKSKMPYAPALRQMLVAPETAKSELDTIVTILAELHDTESVPLIRAILLDETANMWLRREALDALDKLGAADVLDMSIRVYRSLDPDKDGDEGALLSTIAEVFGKYGDTSVIPLLQRLKKNRVPFDDRIPDANRAIESIRERAKGARRLDASAE
jgi:hypothetical protein